MKEMNSYIEIGNLIFRNRSNDIRIKSSRKDLTSTATIRLPRYSKLLTDDQSEYRISPGMPVTIRLGYDGEFKQEWIGYVTKVLPNTPLEIQCEDEMWKYKQEQVSESWDTISLKNLLMYIAPAAQIECPNITLSPFRLDKVTKAQALAKIKEEYGLDVYFRGKKLYAGLSYLEKGLGSFYYHAQKNIPSVSQQSSLMFKRREDVKLKVKCISILSNNKRIEVELGDPDGEQRTKTFYNIKTEAELKAIGQEAIDDMKYDGYSGKLTTYGFPVPEHGGIANIMNDEYPERTSSVFIDGVETSYSSSGYRQEVELGRRAA